MAYFGCFYLDKEKDIVVDLDLEGGRMAYTLRTPNHGGGNLIRNLARMCELPLSWGEDGLLVIRGTVPCYIDDRNEDVYVFRLRDTKVANIYPDGTIERKASIPAISKTLMSQTKDYRLDFKKTVVKTYILSECKFRTDLHTHMNANLSPDRLIALGIRHQIRYPLYYIKKLGLRLTKEQQEVLARRRLETAERFRDSALSGKYLERRIDDYTCINFADLILNNPGDAAWNIPRIRASLAVMKDGQAVFTNLEKVYLYRYVFTRGTSSTHPVVLDRIGSVPDPDIRRDLLQMMRDHSSREYSGNSLFQDKLLWIARGYREKGIRYVEISDTALVKPSEFVGRLKEIHEIMPRIYRETGVMIRFLASFRRVPLTIIRDRVERTELAESLRVLGVIASDPYVAGTDIVGEEMNDIRELRPLIREIVRIASGDPGFVIRIHAGENDSLRDNVMNSILEVKHALLPGQQMPNLRIGHGLYTANLDSAKGKALIRELKEDGAVLEFQITSNVRLNNLSELSRHPLKKYLQGGVMCVQGTDGGALYGTDSIDEQLALEKMLDLSYEDLLSMRRTEMRVIEVSEKAFDDKMRAFDRHLGLRDAGEYYAEEFARSLQHELQDELVSGKRDSEEALKERIRPLPEGKTPIVLLGGSFNHDARRTRQREEICRSLSELLDRADPKDWFFVIGHRLAGYEKLLLEENRGRFEIFSFVPSEITDKEAAKILKSGVSVRVSIEASGLGIYKSLTYEIFKRRPSVLIGLDGNSAGANMIQEAKNGRGGCRIYVSARCRELREKASSLAGYVTVFSDPSGLADQIAGGRPGENP